MRFGFALVATAACSTGERDSANNRRAPRASVDSGPPITTREMSEGLTRDVRESDRELVALQDSIYRFVGDSLSAVLQRAGASWEQYRKLECDAIRLTFAPGTMAPIAQMECWIELTDERRHFLVEQYDYMRPGRAPSRSGAR
jgi:uncharacterized protein YecT (DUF1311 family)